MPEQGTWLNWFSRGLKKPGKLAEKVRSLWRGKGAPRRKRPKQKPTAKPLWAIVDVDDIHCLMIGASGVGKTAFFLYPNLEYACASGMSFLALDIHGPVPSSVDSAVPYSNEKSVGNPPIGPAGSTISRLTNVRSRRSRNLNLNVPSSACITSCGITECQSSPNCSQTSRQPKTGNCSGAWTSWN